MNTIAPVASDINEIVDTWRPSRDRVIARGEFFWTEVDILNMQLSGEAAAVANGLARFGIKPNIYNVGLAEHIKKVLGGTSVAKAPYLIIAAHGAAKDGDLLIGDNLPAELAATQDFHHTLTPDDLAKFIDVSGKTVINLACGSGDGRLAEVFTKKGSAAAYIADTYAPFTYVSYLFPILLFYFLTKYPDLSIEQAFKRAQASDTEEFGTWQITQ